MAIDGEKLYSAIQSGKVDPTRLSREHKDLVKKYIATKTATEKPKSNYNEEWLAKHPVANTLITPFRKFGEWYEDTAAGKFNARVSETALDTMTAQEWKPDRTTTGSGIADAAASGLGMIGGFAMSPVSGASLGNAMLKAGGVGEALAGRAIAKGAPKLVENILPTAARGAAGFGAYEGLAGLAQDEDAKGIAKRALMGVAMGAVLDPVIEKALLPALKTVATRAIAKYKGKKVDINTLVKTMADDIGVDIANMNEKQMAALTRAAQKAKSEPIQSGKFLAPVKGEGQGFTMSDPRKVTPAELLGNRPLMLGAGEQQPKLLGAGVDHTLGQPPMQFKTQMPKTNFEKAKAQTLPQQTEKIGSLEFQSQPIQNKTPIDARDFKNVGSQKVKAISYENPLLQPYYQSEAKLLKRELADSIKGEKFSTVNADGERVFTGTKKFVSETVENIQGITGASYKDIDNALEAIIKNKGRENNALSKRIELLIDDNLSGGYKTFDGIDIPANRDYLLAKQTAEKAPKLVQKQLALPRGKYEPDFVMLGEPYRAKTQGQQVGFKTQIPKPIIDKTPIPPAGYKTTITGRGFDKTPVPPIPVDFPAVQGKPNILTGLQGKASTAKVAETILPKTEERILLKPDKGPLNIKNKLKKLYSNVFNSQDKLGSIGNETKILASNARQSKGVVDYIAEKALVNKEGVNIGASLKELAQLIPTEKELDFWRYAAHTHNISRAAEGKNVFAMFDSNASLAEAQKILENNPEFKEPAKKVTEWINKFMDTWADDLLGEETLKFWKALYPDYIPVNREVGELSKISFDGAKRGFVNQDNIIKRAVGAKADLSSDIKNPLGNILNLVNKTVKAAKNNEVGKSILEEIRKGGLDDIFEIVPTKQGLVDDINVVLKEEGIEGVMTRFASQFDDVFKQAEKGNNVVKIMEKGKEVLVKVKDAEYLKALQSLSDGTGKSAAEQFEKAARRVASPIKSLITGKNPLFAAFNIMRDTPTAFIQGQESNPIKFTMRYFRAIKEIANNSKGFNEFVAQGGMQSGFFKNDVLRTIESLKKTDASIFEKAVRKIEMFNNLTEATPRYMEYMATLEKGGTKAQGIYNAAEVTVNFARNGKWGKFFDSFILYLNPALQGLDKVVRQFYNKPIQTALKATGIISVPYALTEQVNKDNPHYKQTDQRTKDDFFLIPNKFGPTDTEGYAETFFRIPKARQYGFLFAVLLNRVGQLAEGKSLKDASKGLGGALSRDALVPTRPTWAPFTDIGRNKDWKGAPINPLGMEMDDRPSYLKYDETTSEIGKVLAKMLNEQPIEGIKLSPKDINYLIDSYTGIIGDVLLPATTKNKRLIDVPKRKFIVDSVYSNQAVTDFYDNLNRVRSLATEKNITGNIPSKIVTPEEKIRNAMNKISSDMSALNKKIKSTEDAEEQRELRKKYIDYAIKGNKLLMSIKK